MRRMRELWLVDVPALGYAVAAACGALVGILGISTWLGISVVIAFVVTSAFALIFVKQRRIGMLFVLAAFALLISYRANHGLQREARQRIASEFPDACAGEVVGRVCWKEPARDDRSGYLWLDQTKISTDSGECACGDLRVRLRVGASDYSAAQIGDIAAGHVRFVPAQQMYASRSGLLFWSAAQRHCGDASLRENEALELMSGRGGLTNALFEFRQGILEVLETQLSPDARAMCGALLLGERVGFSPEFQGDLYVTGLTHLFALSGLNTGLITALLWFVLSLLRTPLAARGAVVLAVLVLYAALGVGAPSLVRSSLMAAMIIGTRLLHRKGNSANYILAAFAIELFIWPLHALDAGFLLSYLAIAGLTAGYSALAEPIARWFGEGKFGGMRRPAQLVGSAISAQISTAPMTAMLFGRVPGFAVLANIIAVPGFSLLLVLTLLLVVSSFISGAIAGWIANSVEAISFCLTRVVTWSAMLPGAGFTLIAPLLVSVGWLAASVGAIVALLRLRARWAIALLMIGLNGVIWADVFMTSDEPFVVQVTERCVMLGADEAMILVGCGSAWESERVGRDVVQALRAREQEELDVIVLPDARASSIGALPGVLEAVDVRTVLWQKPSNETWTSAVCDATLQQFRIEPVIARVGTMLKVKDRLEIRVLWPPEGIRGESAILFVMKNGARVVLTAGVDQSEIVVDRNALHLVVSRDGKISIGEGQVTHGEWKFEHGKWLHAPSATERYATLMKLPYAA